ncbi:uncharacterized protein LOC120275319 [Dioscorea cayenensis subsp. rotundata]|uniref:Uncharacterized protein LOC120275319 n=1 Tax=Dioscorea cayennensis subsp. rotundata TaxID=55577 RepID=A0AB40CEG4_DIOCR|nr:uncharacterized protein LOC120275319 [Dioscorea cayenensis subsp. rotundata]
MALTLNVHQLHGAPPRRLSPPLSSLHCAIIGTPNPQWSALKETLNSHGRHSCFFSDGRKEDRARKALEDALGGKKTELEKWNKEIKKREERGGGGTSGRGGWFGGGGWFGWSGGEHFWEEAQQASITVIAIIAVCLLIAKGNVMFAVVFNSLLFALRGLRNSFSFLPLRLFGKTSVIEQPNAAVSNQNQMSAKERVVRKWGMD